MRPELRLYLPFDLYRWWSPVFFDLEKDAEVPRPATYELRVGLPACSDNGEALFAVYHHENTFDNLVNCARYL